MLKVNTDLLYESSEKMLIDVSNVNDLVLRVSRICNEVESDLVLANYPQMGIIVDSLNNSREQVTKLAESMELFGNIFSSVHTEYEDMEKELMVGIKKLSCDLDSIGITLSSVISDSTYVAPIIDQKSNNMNELVNTVAFYAEEMRTANISPVVNKVEEEYRIKEVKTVED